MSAEDLSAQPVSQTPAGSVPGTPASVAGPDAAQGESAASVQPAEAEQLVVALPPCGTCGRPTTEDNSLVVVRSSGKQADLRRCKWCHATKAAISRLQTKAGALVTDFLAIGKKEATEQFFRERGHLRGQQLVVAMEEAVQEWKVETSLTSFKGEGDYVDEQELHAERPEQLENLLATARTLWHPARKVTLYEDLQYTVKHVDSVEHARKRQRGSANCCQRER